MIVVKNKSKSINLNFIEISEFIKKIDFNNFLSMSVCKIAISQVTSQKKCRVHSKRIARQSSCHKFSSNHAKKKFLDDLLHLTYDIVNKL